MNALTKTLAALTMFFATASANAYILQTNGGNGTIDSVVGTPPTSFRLTGDDSAQGLITTTYSQTFSVGGFISFNWAYSSFDEPFADAAGYLIDGKLFELASTDGRSGSENVSLLANQVFGWYVKTQDGEFGPGILEVRSISFQADGDSASVPEPTSLALLGLGLVSLAGLRRKKI